jgi:predicted  nucleic acid-binding Zn-ribbon protein
MVDEVKRAKEMAASATAQLEAAGKLSERLANKVTGLESDNKRLLDSLHEAREQIDGMKAQLHAAQASKTFPRLVRE